MGPDANHFAAGLFQYLLDFRITKAGMHAYRPVHFIGTECLTLVPPASSFAVLVFEDTHKRSNGITVGVDHGHDGPALLAGV